MTEKTPRSLPWGKALITLLLAFFYAYPMWSAVGNLISLPSYYADQFGVSADKVPWVLLWAGVLAPLAVFTLALVFGWRRGTGSLALLLTVGFAIVSAVGLDLIAIEKDVEIHLVIDFLTGK